MFDLRTSEPPLPLTGFALFRHDRLLLQGGMPAQLCFCQPDQLSSDAFKQLLGLLEVALGAQRNDLAQTDPASIRSVLQVIILCAVPAWRDPFTGAVLAHGIQPPFPPCTFDHAEQQPSGGGIRQSMADQLSRLAFPARICVADLEHLGDVPETTGPQVA